MDDLRLELSIFHSITTISYEKLISCWHCVVPMINSTHTHFLSSSALNISFKNLCHTILFFNIFWPVQVYRIQGRLYHRLTARFTTTTTLLQLFSSRTKKLWYFSGQTGQQTNRSLPTTAVPPLEFPWDRRKEPFATTTDCLLEHFEMFQKRYYLGELYHWNYPLAVDGLLLFSKGKEKPVPSPFKGSFTINRIWLSCLRLRNY